MLDHPRDTSTIRLSAMNAGALSTYGGVSRLQTRFLREPGRAARLLEQGSFDAKDALRAGLVTFAPDEIDWEDEVRAAR